MKIEEIVRLYGDNMRSCVTRCDRNKIDRWELIDHLHTPVYITPAYAGVIEIKSRCCLLCGTKGTVGHHNGYFILKLLCSCGKDGTSIQSIDKLRRFLSTEDAAALYAELCRKKCHGLKNTTEYWISKGCSPIESKLEISKIQKDRSDRSPSARPGSREYSVRCKEYWQCKGMDEDQASEKVKEYQTHNGLDWYQKKYGDEQGEILFQERISRWLETYYGREDIDEINSRKSFTKEQRIEKYGLAEYILRTKKRMQKQMETKIALGQWTDPSLLDDRNLYNLQVDYYTHASLAFYYDAVNPARLPISWEKNQIDHIFSKHHGFMFGVPPEIIGSYINLRVIPSKENQSKGPRSDYTLDQLKELYETVDENWHIIVRNASV
jgi:hypothetical protein